MPRLAFLNTHHAQPYLAKVLGLSLILLSAAGSLQAELSVSAHISTIGPGLEVAYKFNPAFGVRAAWQQFTKGYDYTPDDENGVSGDELNYKGDIDVRNASLFADWYPYQGQFRVTTGFLINNSGTKLITNCQTNASGILPSPGNCQIGNGSVLGSDIGELHIAIDFEESIAPYLGIGWAFQTDKHWHFNADLGVAYLGKGNADIQSSGSCNTSTSCRSQLDEEERKIEKEMESFEFFPVAKLGFGYRF